MGGWLDEDKGRRRTRQAIGLYSTVYQRARQINTGGTVDSYARHMCIDEVN